MDLLIVPVPLFNRDMAVEAYYLRHQKGNDILEASKGVTIHDGAMNSAPLEMLNGVGLDAITMGKPIVVPINNFMLLASLELQCKHPPEKIIFLLDADVRVEAPYIANLIRLKGLGFRFGIQKITELERYTPILKHCSYIFYHEHTLEEDDQRKLREAVNRRYGQLTCVYTHIPTMERFQLLCDEKDRLYEGRFYRTPLTKGSHEVSPLQVNLINLLNLVREDNFEFADVSKIIERDTALTVLLLRLVNSPYIGLRNRVKTINHAVTMLGQDEIRIWISTAVSKLLGSEKPSELTRLSLVRARFCAGLAGLFGLKSEAQSLYLMGLFSVLDAILDMPMDEALRLVHVSDTIQQALLRKNGPFYPVYQFMLLYENADWKTVSRIMILRDIATAEVYRAYMDALCWYGEVLCD